MQGHAFYLALAYGVTGLCLVAEIIILWRRCRHASRISNQTANAEELS